MIHESAAYGKLAEAAGKGYTWRMDLKNYFAKKSLRKRLAAAASHAETIRRMERHLASPEEDARLRDAVVGARKAAKSARTMDELNAAMNALDAALGEGSSWRPLHPHALAENFEVLVVAIAVAMAFRCYFLQPFKIPTGSMQPTLYGIHTVTHSNPTEWDKMPLKVLKWCATGEWYTEVRVGQGGTVSPLPTTVKPGYVTFRVAGANYHVPAEAVVEKGMLNVAALRDLRPNGTIPSGGVLWSGTVKAGDHVFVNRVAWNFRYPRRGDVMVFSTTGIEGLPDGTHYIKRMSGLPGEKVQINPPNLLINGEAVMEPYTMARIANMERITPDAPPYAGYTLITTNNYVRAEAPVPLCSKRDKVTLGPNEYYALGDNTTNSRDSRYWGPVPDRNLLGPAAFIYWPFTRFRLID